MGIKEIDLGNVKGPKGDPGPKGETGEQGPEGPQGKPGKVDADTAIAFEQASQRENIKTGESIKTIFGKIAKFLADLKNVAFTGSYNDLKDKPGLKTVATSGNYNDLENKPSSFPANGGNANTVGGKSAAELMNYNNHTNRPALGAAASQNVANNLTTNTAGSVLDARQGKALNDKYTTLNSALKVYSDFVAINFTPDGTGLEFSWGTYVVPTGYCFLHAVIADNSQLKGKYLGILTQRYDSSTRLLSLYLNWRYSGSWGVLITLAKEKR